MSFVSLDSKPVDYKWCYTWYLLPQQRLQDGQVPAVPQAEDNHLPGVVEPRSSGHVELRAARGNEGAHRVAWTQNNRTTEHVRTGGDGGRPHVGREE